MAAVNYMFCTKHKIIEKCEGLYEDEVSGLGEGGLGGGWVGLC